MQGNSKEIQTPLDSQPPAQGKPRAGTYRFGDFELHPSERLLYRRNKRLALPPKAFDALLLLVSNAERLVRKEELMRALWPDTFVEQANLTNTVVTLRKVLGKSAIETVSKFGYRFALPVTGEPGVDDDVYATFVRAKHAFAPRSPEAARSARDLFLLCVTKDPNFAAAWAWLGRCYRFLEKFGVDPTVNVDLALAAFRRALAIDPRNAAAHQFFTNLQTDMGQARDAMIRLTTRVAEGSEDAESYAGLVQTFRFCGLLPESVAAHTRAIALDPMMSTSVAHTYFLLGDYKATIAHYPTALKYYLDAAAWAASGHVDEAKAMLRERMPPGAAFPALFKALLGTLLAALEGRQDEVVQTIHATAIDREPESIFYLSRHCGLVDAASDAIALVAHARREGFVSSYALSHDTAFATIRSAPAFQSEMAAAVNLEHEARTLLPKSYLRGAPR